MSNISTRPPLKIPHYEQKLSNSCLPASVRMVLAYYGTKKSEESLRRLLKTKAAGTNPLNVTYLRDWNFKVSVSFSNLDELKDYIFQEKPIIVLLWTGELSYWNSKEYFDYLHSVVVVGFDEENVFINDPAFPNYPILIPYNEFLEAWSYSQQMLILIEKQ